MTHTVALQYSIFNDLKVIKALVYDPCGLDMTDFKQHTEGGEYAACTFLLNKKSIQHRASKITPTKTGQFVTIWKRNDDRLTVPYDAADEMDILMITSRSGDNLGQFMFPKWLLVAKGIISHKGKGGKRGMRVYPPWDTVTSKQATETQRWQIQYFLTIRNDNSTGLDLAKILFSDGGGPGA